MSVTIKDNKNNISKIGCCLLLGLFAGIWLLYDTIVNGLNYFTVIGLIGAMSSISASVLEIGPKLLYEIRLGPYYLSTKNLSDAEYYALDIYHKYGSKYAVRYLDAVIDCLGEYITLLWNEDITVRDEKTDILWNARALFAILLNTPYTQYDNIVEGAKRYLSNGFELGIKLSEKLWIRYLKKLQFYYGYCEDILSVLNCDMMVCSRFVDIVDIYKPDKETADKILIAHVLHRDEGCVILPKIISEASFGWNYDNKKFIVLGA